MANPGILNGKENSLPERIIQRLPNIPLKEGKSMDYEQMPSSQNQGNYYQNQHDPNKDVMGMGEWLITLIVLAIPCVNIIMYFVWAFGNGNENRKNFCRAGLIMMAVGIVLTILLYSIIGISIVSSMA